MSSPVAPRETNMTTVVAPPRATMPACGSGDLELRLLQACSEYAGHAIVRSYTHVKHSSRVLGVAASAGETVATTTGLVALARFLYNQYLRLGHPMVRYVDDAVGRCVVSAFVRILLAVEYQQRDGPHRLLTATGEPLELTFYERLQALLYGQVPRLQSLVLELMAREQEHKNRPAPVAISLENFVPKEEIDRLQQESSEALQFKEDQIAALHGEIASAERARHQLEQEMKSADARSLSESQQLLLEREQQISTLKEQVRTADQERGQLEEELERLKRHNTKVLEAKEREVAALQESIESAERAREQLEQTMKNLESSRTTETLSQRSEKDAEITTLKKLVETATREREQMKNELDQIQEQRSSEHEQVLAEKETEVASLKEKFDAVERARTQLHLNLHEALDIKEHESQEALAEKEKEVATLKSEVEAINAARKKLEEGFEATRLRMESEHAQRVKELEEELEQAKQEAFDKGHELRAMTLRQQRASNNGSILIKEFVDQAKVDSPSAAQRVSDNQLDEHELSHRSESSTLSSPASSIGSTSPRMKDDKKLKAAIEKQKLNARMHRVFGSRF